MASQAQIKIKRTISKHACGCKGNGLRSRALPQPAKLHHPSLPPLTRSPQGTRLLGHGMQGDVQRGPL